MNPEEKNILCIFINETEIKLYQQSEARLLWQLLGRGEEARTSLQTSPAQRGPPAPAWSEGHRPH